MRARLISESCKAEKERPNNLLHELEKKNVIRIVLVDKSLRFHFQLERR